MVGIARFLGMLAAVGVAAPLTLPTTVVVLGFGDPSEPRRYLPPPLLVLQLFLGLSLPLLSIGWACWRRRRRALLGSSMTLGRVVVGGWIAYVLLYALAVWVNTHG